MTQIHEIDATYSFDPADVKKVVSLLQKVVTHAAQEDGAELSLKVDEKTQNATLSLIAKTDGNLERILMAIGPDLTEVAAITKVANVDFFGPTPHPLRAAMSKFNPSFAAMRH